LATVDDTQCVVIPGDGILVCTAEDGVTSLTYTVHFFFLGYDATLFDLTVDGTTIPDFDPNITSYQYVVEDIVTIPVVDGITSDPLASLTITQATSIPGEANLLVVAEDGVTELTYTVYFYTLATDATLMDLTLDGTTIEGFDPAIVYYEYDVIEGDLVPIIDGTTNDPLATLEITQASTAPGDGTLLVTAQDGITQLTYTVHFNLILGIDNSSDNLLTIYPNPVVSELHFSGLTAEIQVDVISLLGEHVFMGKVTENQSINTEFLKEGIYFVKISQHNGKTSILRFIKK
jgi:hypothetical protein